MECTTMENAVPTREPTRKGALCTFFVGTTDPRLYKARHKFLYYIYGVNSTVSGKSQFNSNHKGEHQMSLQRMEDEIRILQDL
jgi:hypothetical protein